MARITQIVLSMGRRENDRNFGTYASDYSETIILDENDSRTDAIKAFADRGAKALTYQLRQAALVSAQRKNKP